MTTEPVSIASSAERDPWAAKGSIQSIERAAQILALFDQDTTSLSATMVAERLGLNRTTAHRYLMSLQSSGFLGRSNGPGPLLDQLASIVLGRRQLLRLAPPIMRRLSDQLSLTVVLSVLGRTGAVVVAVEESQAGRIVLTIRIGTVLDITAAQSRILLAFQSDPTVISRFHAGLSADAVLEEQAELAQIRREQIGWGNITRLGHAAVAAPVFGTRNVQAAIALLGTERSLPRGRESERTVRRLRDAAGTLSRLIGA